MTGRKSNRRSFDSALLCRASLRKTTAGLCADLAMKSNGHGIRTVPGSVYPAFLPSHLFGKEREKDGARKRWGVAIVESRYDLQQGADIFKIGELAPRSRRWQVGRLARRARLWNCYKRAGRRTGCALRGRLIAAAGRPSRALPRTGAVCAGPWPRRRAFRRDRRHRSREFPRRGTSCAPRRPDQGARADDSRWVR